MDRIWLQPWAKRSVRVREVSMTHESETAAGPSLVETPPDPVPSMSTNDMPHGGNFSDLVRALQAMRIGDFSVRMPADMTGLMGKIADAFNEIASTNQRMAQPLGQLGQVVGKEGRTRQRLRLGLATGSWVDMENAVNSLIDDLLWPTTEVTRTIASVAQGDLLATMRLDVDGRPLKGEFLRSANIVN